MYGFPESIPRAQGLRVDLRGVTTPGTRPHPRKKPWTEDEVRTFLAHVVSDRLYTVMLLSLIGPRPAEVCGVRWTDIDLTACPTRWCRRGPVTRTSAPRSGPTCTPIRSP
ncbi:hypothetical protein GCM10023080_063630 [Streptomyces pseudoechinosporeus]